ncbi:synaptonemal complex protein 1 [Acyrthosiphon pisum]|uniref:Uncharacterized protein n=1 Tax=Acyrthosiphon pisum TaxID=7029 RepID=A0A8R1W8R7_ACYPI|nr:synaptonemal complex protein 1 [Acyrthosiphon pisum]|eukprot:XP_003242276.1 PREDICTED: synaptonemal complex protein 1 [Acyrthosiphon pisum]
MTDSKDELEIVSTNFEIDDNDGCLQSIRDADKKAVNIAKIIIQLKQDLANMKNDCGATKSKEMEVCKVQEQLAEMVAHYKKTVAEVHSMANTNNFDLENLECQKIDIAQLTNPKNCMTSVVKASDKELIAPWILINNEQEYPTFFRYDLNNNGIKFNEHDNESICSCNDESENCCLSDCEDKCIITDNCYTHSKNSDTDCINEGFKNELMSMKGGIKILNQQNRDFLCKLNSANQQTLALTNSLKNKLASEKSKGTNDNSTCFPDHNESKSQPQVLMLEINRLNDELKRLQRDKCQIELAKKVLNISENMCPNCADTKTLCNDLEPKTAEYNKLLADYNNKLLEIADLRNMLTEAECNHKTCEGRLTILKTQVCQLQKQLFEFNSAKSHDPEVAISNEKYLIESLRSRLLEATEEKNNMQTVLDFHLTELEDKKSKYLAVLQTNQEQKFRIESICKEKNTIAEEYEAEFNRMNDHLKSCLEELGTLPGLLATAQRDLEKETIARTDLENDRINLLNEIQSLKAILANDDVENKDKKLKSLEEENIQLRAMILTLEASLEENKRLYKERTHYSLQLKENLDLVRKEAALQVTKTKNFTECQMLKYVEYIKQLEQKLVEHRAIACLEFQKRDQIDARLRNQIEVLTTNLNEAQKQMGYIIKAKDSMENKTKEDVCNIPRVLNSVCNALNTPNHLDRLKDD